MYLEGTSKLPTSMRVLTVVDVWGDASLRLADSSTCEDLECSFDARVEAVRHATLLGRVGDAALYSLEQGSRYLVVECGEFFGESLDCCDTLAEALESCRSTDAARREASNLFAYRVPA